MTEPKLRSQPHAERLDILDDFLLERYGFDVTDRILDWENCTLGLSARACELPEEADETLLVYLTLDEARVLQEED
jgi:hypothetical protein